jgi:hypothetical protein
LNHESGPSPRRSSTSAEVAADLIAVGLPPSVDPTLAPHLTPTMQQQAADTFDGILAGP